MDTKLLLELITIAMTSSTITLAFIQKMKIYCKSSKILPIISFFVNMILGVLFCLTFTEVSFPTSLWVGFFSFIGADTLYKALEGKLKSQKELAGRKEINIERDDV